MFFVFMFQLYSFLPSLHVLISRHGAQTNFPAPQDDPYLRLISIAGIHSLWLQVWPVSLESLIT